MARLLHKPERSKANKRRNRSKNKFGRPEKCEGAKIISGLDSTPVQVHKQHIQDSKWKWTTEIDDDFEKLKKEILGAPCLTHFNPKKDNYVTIDACNINLRATLWQKEGEVFRPIAFASKFLSDCERNYASNELE